MADPILIFDDPRPIHSIWFNDSQHIKVGQGLKPSVEAIVAYREPGMGSDTAWIAIYRGGAITDRIPAWKVRIRYA